MPTVQTVATIAEAAGGIILPRRSLRQLQTALVAETVFSVQMGVSLCCQLSVKKIHIYTDEIYQMKMPNSK